MRESAKTISEESFKLNIESSLSGDLKEINKGLRLCEISNGLEEQESATISVGSQFITYLFANDHSRLSSSVNQEETVLDQDHYAMMTFPMADWSIEVNINPGQSIWLIFISISELHAIFGNFEFQDPDMLKEALRNYRQQSFLTKKVNSPAVRSIIHEIFVDENKGIARLVFQKGKVMEFLSKFLESDNERAVADCPYIKDSLDWEKIRRSEIIIREDLMNPPTIRELAKRVGTNEFKLKVGFKHLYKKTIYHYLNDYRMEQAREMLLMKGALIKDISEKVGYSSTSHFIASFKKKYGITPKQFVKQ